MEICSYVSAAGTPKANGSSQGPGEEMGRNRTNRDALFCPVPASPPDIWFVGMLSTLTERDTKGHDAALERWYDGHTPGTSPH